MSAPNYKNLPEAVRQVDEYPPLAVQMPDPIPASTFLHRPGHLIPLIAFLLLALGLSSCASLLDPGPPPSRLRLSPAMPARMAGSPLNKQVIVGMPLAGRDIDTDSIALVFNGREVRYLSGVRWTSPVPHIVQRSLIDALTATNGLRGVSDESAGMFADAKLLSDIRQFALRYDDPKGTPTAVVTINFSLLSLSDGAILDTLNVNVTATALGRDNMALVTACETALSSCLSEVAPWVVWTMKTKGKR